VLILVEVAEKSAEIDGLRTVWLEGTPTPGDPGRAAIVYLHGNPVGSWIWEPFLTRTGGVAPDLPGFGRTAKPESFDYSLSGYADFLERFTEELGLERFSLVVHDIGAITGLVFAQRVPERIERLVIANHAPLLPGYRWHRFARIWRAPVLGELFMATTTRFVFKRSLRRSNVGGVPDEFVARAWGELEEEPSARSCASTARCPRGSWPARDGTSAGSVAPRSSSGQRKIPTLVASSAPPTARRSGATSRSRSTTMPGIGYGSIAPM
jgi:pimeloyl-ACP methyl ester carboxylesterase